MGEVVLKAAAKEIRELKAKRAESEAIKAQLKEQTPRQASSLGERGGYGSYGAGLKGGYGSEKTIAKVVKSEDSGALARCAC